MWNSLFADNCHKLNVFGMCAKHPKVSLVGEYASLQIISRINIRLDRIIFLPFHNELKAHFKIAFLQIVKLNWLLTLFSTPQKLTTDLVRVSQTYLKLRRTVIRILLSISSWAEHFCWERRNQTGGSSDLFLFVLNYFTYLR